MILTKFWTNFNWLTKSGPELLKNLNFGDIIPDLGKLENNWMPVKVMPLGMIYWSIPHSSDSNYSSLIVDPKANWSCVRIAWKIQSTSCAESNLTLLMLVKMTESQLQFCEKCHCFNKYSIQMFYRSKKWVWMPNLSKSSIPISDGISKNSSEVMDKQLNLKVSFWMRKGVTGLWLVCPLISSKMCLDRF